MIRSKIRADPSASSSSTLLSGTKKDISSPCPTAHYQHRRISIFNPLTKESRPSVIQLSVSKPVPSRARQLVFTSESTESGTGNAKPSLQTSAIDNEPQNNTEQFMPSCTQTLHSIFYRYVCFIA